MHTDNNTDTYTRNRMPLKQGHLAKNVAKLTEEQARIIKYSIHKSKELQTMFNVAQSQISRIRTGKTWKNI